MTDFVVSSGVSSSLIQLQPGDTEEVLSGGESFRSLVNSGSIETDYGYSSAAIINGGEDLVSGGQSVDATLINGGSQTVYAGSSIDPAIFNGGEITVSSGLAESAQVESYAALTVDGGSATDAQVESYAVVTVDGGSVTGAQINAASLYVSGGVVEGAKITGSSTVSIDGGQLNDTTIDGGAYVTISGGSVETLAASDSAFVADLEGQLSSVSVATGAQLLLEYGDTTSSIVVSSGGFLDVFQGSTVVGAIIMNGGSAVIVNSSTSDKILVESGGTLNRVYLIDDGVTSSGLTLHPGDRTSVYGGGTVEAFTVQSGARIDVDGGFASGIRVQSGGLYNIRSGSGSGAIISGGGSAHITASTSGDILRGAAVQGSGFVDAVEVVGVDGSASGTNISAGGRQDVTFLPGSFGGTASSFNAKVFSGGVLETDGLVSGVLVQSGGELLVDSNATVSGAVIRVGATVDFSGESFDSARVSGSELIGTSSGQTVVEIGLQVSSSGLTFTVTSDGQGGTEIVVGSTHAHASRLRQAAAVFHAGATTASTLSAHELQSARIEMAAESTGAMTKHLFM